MREVRKTNCHFCGYLCAFHATVEDGRVVDLEPDPSRYPYDPKVLAGCRRWKMNLDVLDGDDRVNYPLRRVGERGANNWERVSWDEALDLIASKFGEIKQAHVGDALAAFACSRSTNEDIYLPEKMARCAFETNNVDNCARV